MSPFESMVIAWLFLTTAILAPFLGDKVEACTVRNTLIGRGLVAMLTYLAMITVATVSMLTNVF